MDAGNSTNGKTKELIPELVGWIKACGYDCQVKSESFVAGTIADRIRK
nr:ribonuclease H-like YkuK family protein [Lachnoclostridium sp. Marseille-P6806]